MIEIASKDDFVYLKNKIDNINDLLVFLTNTMSLPEVVTIKDVCKIEKVSRTQIETRERYLLPHFGKSDFPEGTIRWRWATFCEWRRRPIESRKQEYERILNNMK